MSDNRVRMRCPECDAIYNVPAAWTHSRSGEHGLRCSRCLLEKAKMVPLTRDDQAVEDKR
jgi:uncharacterized C2H2 Zn-finger protein